MVTSELMLNCGGLYLATLTHLELVIRPHADQDLPDLDTGSGAVSLAKSSSHSSLEPDKMSFVNKISYILKIFLWIFSVRCGNVFFTVSQKQNWLSYHHGKGQYYGKLLLPISSGTGQHFVDAEDVEGVDPNPDVEPILAAVLDEVLVAADAPGLQSLGGQLLQLVRHQVDREGELVNTGLKWRRSSSSKTQQIAAHLLTSQVEDPNLGVGDTTIESALGIGLVLAVAIALGRSPAHLCF